MIYLDTSALLKRAIDEPGSRKVARLCEEGGPLACATLAYPEALGAVYRRFRAKEFSSHRVQIILRSLEQAWNQSIHLEFHQDVLDRAIRLLHKHPLSGADAIHLASALFLHLNTRTRVTFAAADHQLLTAAHGEDLIICNVATDEPGEEQGGGAG